MLNGVVFIRFQTRFGESSMGCCLVVVVVVCFFDPP